MKTSKSKNLIVYEPRPLSWTPCEPIVLPEIIYLYNSEHSPRDSDWYPIKSIDLPSIIYLSAPSKAFLPYEPKISPKFVITPEVRENHTLTYLWGIPFITGPGRFMVDFNRVETYEPEEIYNLIKSVDNSIRQINSRGYIPSTHMADLPVFSDLMKYFIAPSASGISRAVREVRRETRAQAYKWIYNTLMVNLYALSLKTFYEIDNKTSIDYDIEIVTKFEVLCNELHGYLLPSIRKKLVKKSIQITKEITTGFDTEYQQINFKSNKLLSVQLAVNTQILLTIPLNKEFELSSINCETQEQYKVDYDEQSKFQWLLCQETINSCIDYIRKIKWGDSDEKIKELRTKLDAIKSLDCITKDDSCIYRFPRSATTPFIFYNEDGEGISISFNQIVQIANSIGEGKLLPNFLEIMKFIKNEKTNIELEKVQESPEEVMNNLISINNVTEFKEGYDYKRLLRTSILLGGSQRQNVIIKRCNYFVAHLTNADLCMFSDFEELKEKLNIVQKCYATLGRPLLIDNTDVHIRDTMLLAPAGKRQLSSIGAIHGINKLELSRGEITNMAGLLRENKSKFTDYAVRDAYITLVHANYMEDFMFKLKNVGVPLTLSSLGGKYVKEIWKQSNYKGYQLNSEFLIGDSSKTLTPKGLFNITQHSGVAYHLPLYISNYKGGRNESFMYGVDKNTHWYDYDLTSAYTTVMAFIGNPDYKNAKSWTVEELEQADSRELTYSFTIIKVSGFNFNKYTKYPSIPEFVDETTTVYASSGSAILTGAEYVLAARVQKCELKIESVYYIPFERKATTVKHDHVFDSPLIIEAQTPPKSIVEKMSMALNKYSKDDKEVYEFINHPFLKVLNDVQKMRREHTKGTIENLLYKEMGNSIYGQVVRGINNKMKFDIQSRSTKRMECSNLSNPILASWVTAFIRSILGECLHNTHVLGGKIVSVTTDGFISDIGGLESKIAPNSILLKEFQRMRTKLSGNPEALELKHQGKGIISWTTRGQFSLASNLKAATGLQTHDYSNDPDKLENILLNTLKREDKSVEYIQSSLRSAKELFISGGHVCSTYRDMVFRMQFDNRRRIMKQDGTIIYNELNQHWKLLDSWPHIDKQECYNIRFISKLLKEKPYNMFTSNLKNCKYKSNIMLAARNFVKIILNEELFTKYLAGIGRINPLSSLHEIQNFLLIYDHKLKMSFTQIEKLKNVNIIDHGVPKNQETKSFVEFVKLYFPHFNSELFFNL